jgi:hypothetical protein
MTEERPLGNRNLPMCAICCRARVEDTREFAELLS